ncbi:MAG: PAS domain-containing protein [Candidatus Helarchaeota archaeon]
MPIINEFKEIEELFRIIADQKLIGFIIAQEDSIKFVNDAVSRIYEYPLEEIKGWTRDDFHKSIHPEDRDIAKKDFEKKQKIDGYIAPFYSKRIITKYGKIKWIELYSKGITYHKKPATLMIITDITEREMKFQTLFEDALNPIMVIDEKQNFIDANKAALEFLECSREELISKKIFDWAPPGKLEQQKENHFPFLSPRTVETDYWVNGKIKTLLLNVVPIPISGKIILYGIGQDITVRKQMEDELKESENKLKQILEQSIMAIVIIQDDKIVYANQIASKMTGYPLKEILKWSIKDFTKVIHPDYLSIAVTRITQREKGELKGISDYQYRILTKTGETIWIQGYSKTIDYKGKIAVLSGFIDITHKKKE